MQLAKNIIEESNGTWLAAHQRPYGILAEDLSGLETIIDKLTRFQVAIPSWALGTGGTRFGRFAGSGEPRSLEEKIEDVGLLHQLNQSSGAISLHIPWDIPADPQKIKTLAASYG